MQDNNKCSCGGIIEELEETFECDGCGTSVPKSFLGRKFTLDIVRHLFDEKVVYVYGFKSKKTGNKFGAGVKLEDGVLELVFEEDQWDIVDRCGCGGIVVEFDKSYYCLDCGKSVWKTIKNKKINKKVALDLLAGKRVTLSGFKSNNGNSFKATLYMDEEGKILFSFDKKEEKEAGFNCFCGGEIFESEKLFYCKSCHLKIWKSFLGKKLSKKQVSSLLEGSTVPVKGLKSKKGNVFNAKIAFDKEEKKIKIVEFF